MPHLVTPEHPMGCGVAAVAMATDVPYARALRALFPRDRADRRIVIPGYGKMHVPYPGIADLDQLKDGLKRLGYSSNVVVNAKLDPSTRQEVDRYVYAPDPIWMDAKFDRIIDLRKLKRVTILNFKSTLWMWTHCRVWDPASGMILDPSWGAEKPAKPRQTCVFWYAEIERLDGKPIPAYKPHEPVMPTTRGTSTS